jgi:hypothetical protein
VTVNPIGVSLLVEEHRGEIATAWRNAATEAGGEPALGFAVVPLLRELSLALAGDTPRGDETFARLAVLVRSSARPAQLVREMKLLQNATWQVIGASGAPVAADERLAADAWLMDALAACVERLDRVRQRLDALDAPAPARAPAVPPPLPKRRAAG